MRLIRIPLFLLFTTGLALAQTDSINETEPAAKTYSGPHVGFGVELGMNSLASIAGVTLSIYPIPHVAVDAGIGFGLNNWKFGLQGRYVFLDGRIFHPYVGGALKYTTGWGDETLSMTVNSTDNGSTDTKSFEMATDPATFADISGGIEFRFGHFILRPGVGYSILLGGRNWKFVEGDELTSTEKDALDSIEGSGISMFLGLGFAF